jgi:hypothetical protein
MRDGYDQFSVVQLQRRAGTKMCKPCYQKKRLDVAAAAGTTCVKCGTNTTSKWLKCKDKPGT